MEVLEERVPFRTSQLVDIGDRSLGIAGAVAGPARQQRCDEVGDRSADRLVDVQLRGRIFLRLQVAHADDEAGDTVGFVQGQDAVGELDRLIDVAVGERGDEGAIQKLVVLRIGAKRRTIKCRGGSRVPLNAGMARRQIAARGGEPLQVGLARELRRIVGSVLGRLCEQRTRHGKRQSGDSGNGPAVETGGKRHHSPCSRIYGRDRTISLECEPKRRHPGPRQCRFWPSTARIGVGESIVRLGL